jgi:hypothetical protein
MAISIARITKVNQELPSAPNGFLNLNCLNFFPNNVMYDIPLYEISPYVLKDSDGHLFENLWQFSKVYSKINEQYEVKAGKVIWSHPAEIHITDDNKLTQAFWVWRRKGWNHPYPVRYPNGYYGRHLCICALWYENEQWLSLSYVAARKKIYCKVYANLVQQTNAFKMLKYLYDSGQSLQICEIDVRPGPINEEVLRRELNNDKEPFGHGYVLATCIMGLTHIFDV